MDKKNTNNVIESEVIIKKEKRVNTDNGLLKKVKDNFGRIICLAIGIFVLFFIASSIINHFGSGDIRKVKKVLKNKYYKIDCIDNNCSSLAAYKGNKVGKSYVEIINSDGKTVAKYKDVYDSKNTNRKDPVSVGNGFFIFKKTNVSNNKVSGYSIANKKGKEVYNTKDTLKVLTPNLVLMDDTDKGLNSQSILNSKGKILYTKINDLKTYADNKVISLDIEGSKSIIDGDGNALYSDYYVANEIMDENGEVVFLLVEDSKNNSYNYFSIKDLKIVGDSFQNYTKNGDGTLTITKRENNSTVKYTLYKNGKQKLMGDSKTQSELANEIKKKVDTNKYNLYLTSIYSESQKYIFADEVSSKSFGIYDIKKNKFTKLYGYKNDVSNMYSSISKISNDNELNYYQISCSAYSCDKNEFLIYNLEEGKTVYSLSDEKLRVQNYFQYEDGYKVVKYSYSSTDENYKGQYVLYNDKNKEITKSSNAIAVVDRKLLIGSDLSSSLLIYSVKSKNIMNDDKSLASRIKLDDSKFYRFESNGNIIFINEKGKEALKVASNNDLIYSDKLIVFVKNKKANIFDARTSKIRKYKFKKNEKMNDASGDLIAPYRGVLFVNNSSDNYFKIVNRKGRTIKKIKKSEIQNVYKADNENVIIITKNDSKKQTLYGLCIGK